MSIIELVLANIGAWHVGYFSASVAHDLYRGRSLRAAIFRALRGGR